VSRKKGRIETKNGKGKDERKRKENKKIYHTTYDYVYFFTTYDNYMLLNHPDCIHCIILFHWGVNDVDIQYRFANMIPID
jgi:hypothetical protein